MQSKTLLYISTLLACLFITTAVNAQAEHKVSVRAGKHPTYIRVVFSSTEDAIKQASVVLHKNNSVRIEFKLPVLLEVQPSGTLKNNSSAELVQGMRLSAKDNIYYIAYDFIDDISVSKLASPHRLVIDISLSEKKSTAEDSIPPAQTEDKPQGSMVDPNKSRLDSVVIDAGHGGEDKGIYSNKFSEKEVALSFSRDLSAALTKKGKKTTLTRKTDQAVTIKERLWAVKGKAFDLLLSIHVSSNEDLVIYALNDLKPDKTDLTIKEAAQNKPVADKTVSRFADLLKAQLGASVSVRSSDIKPNIFAVIKRPAILLEIPNPDKTNYDRRFKERLLTALSSVISSMDSAAE